MVAAAAALLAGAGIATQPAFQASKGLHGSTLFTLSLPVSRLRLLSVRAGLGWSLVIAFVVARCTALWFDFPTETLSTMLQQAVDLVICSTGLYAFPTLFATFLDEQWRYFGSMSMMFGLRYLFTQPVFPPSLNLMRAMGEDSPIVSHSMPWAAMAFSLGLAAVLFYAALKIVQRREY